MEYGRGVEKQNTIEMQRAPQKRLVNSSIPSIDFLYGIDECAPVKGTRFNNKKKIASHEVWL